MLNMTESSRLFLKKYLPSALDAKKTNDALDPLYDLIDMKGFDADEEYNAFGREAQSVYDDLYNSND
jgi:hypothetical protein